MARRWLGLLAVLVTMSVVAGACSGDDDDGGSESGSGGGDDQGEADADEAREIPGEDVAIPTVSGPLTGGTQSGPFIAMPTELAERYGYDEREYLVEGEATSYAVEGEQGSDGAWSVTEADSAPYTTRILVRAPSDPEAFDGTVFVEWLNVSAGIDTDAGFGLAYDEILREGSAWVGVSAQAAGIEGGGALSIPGIELQGLKDWDPERYGDLSHPGDAFSYDIFSQAAQALWRPDDVGVDVLDGLRPTHVIATGESQSAARMVSYVNAVQPVAGIYDGFLIHSRGGSGAPLDDGSSVLGDIGPVNIRTDLDQPVLQFETETDLFGVLGFHPARQDDSDTVRTWEVAGTAHADQATLDYRSGAGLTEGFGGLGSAAGGDPSDPGGLGALCGSINQGPQGLVLRAAVHALRAWVVDGTPPPEAPRLEVTGEGDTAAIARDERGIALGGIRTAAVDAPTAVLTGESDADSIICALFGGTTPFDAATLAELYPTHDDYVAAVTEATDAAVDAGFVLEPDAEKVVEAATDADIPG
jgi:hypothetical protein